MKRRRRERKRRQNKEKNIMEKRGNISRVTMEKRKGDKEERGGR